MYKIHVNCNFLLICAQMNTTSQILWLMQTNKFK